VPTSHPALISPIATKILELKPKSVLDLGVGFGKWGAMAREYTDIWAWRFYRSEWQTVITGVEGWERYRSPNWEHYNKVVIGKIQDVLPTLGSFDLVMMLEVLEHFEKEEGKKVISEIMKHTDTAIISYSNCDQHDVRGNDLEEHRSQWDPMDFAEFGISTGIYRDGTTYVAMIKPPIIV